ncbi:uncharacterized protein LDX57_007409 [Aspergillus melleus]|uniref:uncharacterized protein n=1 Tax=Aspergillus melleus TaxID=138277 RepID=UPI001E8E5CFC|nr:uncharacterized protein LDX57_007409 [Aspergillus melleus]KAH8429737.1 hypothetical protein LDX57_007409 [Aspergillus melleus]
MSKVASQSGSRHKASAAARISSFVHSSSVSVNPPPKTTASTFETYPSKHIRRRGSYEIRNLKPSTGIQDPTRKTETFRQDDAEIPATPTPPATPAPRQREEVPTSAPPPAPAPVPACTITAPTPDAQPAEPLGRPIPAPQRDYRPTTPIPDGTATVPPLALPVIKRTVSIQRAPVPITMTPIPEEPTGAPGDHIDELKTGLQALLSKMDVMQHEAHNSSALAEKEEEIESLHTYIANLENRHKRAKELLANREIQVLQLEGQLATERSNAALLKTELEMAEDARAEFEESVTKEKQNVVRLEEEKRLVNELLQESENSNNLIYDELSTSEEENESLIKLLTEANTVINRLRDEKAEDAFFIQATQQMLLESEARNALMQKNAEEASQADMVDEKKTSDIEERYQKERDQWADIFDTQRIQISKFEDKLMELQNEIEQFHTERAKHQETESDNQMLRTRIVFLQFQRVALTKRRTEIERQLSTAQKAVIETQNRLTGLQKAYEKSEKLLQVTQLSIPNTQPYTGWNATATETLCR